MSEEQTRRGRGRPEIGPEVRGLRLPPDALAEVEALAEAAGVKRGVVLRDLVLDALDRRRRKRTGS